MTMSPADSSGTSDASALSTTPAGTIRQMTRGARQCLHELFERLRGGGAIFRQGRDRFSGAIVGDHLVSAPHEPARHVRAHPAEADHPDLHALSIRELAVDRRPSSALAAYWTTTAVPLTVTISMLALVPTVS